MQQNRRFGFFRKLQTGDPRLVPTGVRRDRRRSVGCAAAAHDDRPDIGPALICRHAAVDRRRDGPHRRRRRRLPVVALMTEQQKPKPWRDWIKVHPACAKYPMMLLSQPGQIRSVRPSCRANRAAAA